MKKYKTNKFQHFPFHIIAPSQGIILLNFYLFNLHLSTLGHNRTLFSTNYIGMEKKHTNLTGTMDSNKNSTLYKDGCDLTDTNSESLNKNKTGIEASPNVCNGSGNVKISLFKRFILKIKNYYRRAVIAVKKGYSVNNVPPKTENLMSKPLIKLFYVLGVICMGLYLSQSIFVFFYVYFQYTIIFIYIMFGLFLVYISILR